MFCIKCKFDIEDDSVFCRFCGKKQVATARAGHRGRSRPNGSGTVRRRGRTWTAVYRSYKCGVAVVTRTKGGFATKADALDYLPTLKGQGEAAPAYTIAQMFARVQLTKKWLEISPDKRSHYLTAYKRLAPIYDRDVVSLRYFELQNLIDGIEGAFYPKRDAKTVLQKIYDLAVLQECVPPGKAEIIRHIELPSRPLTKQDARTPEEMRALWADWHASQHPITGYALLMAYTGQRTGELFAQDVAKIDVPRRLMIGGIKTAAGIDREIPIAEAVVPVLEKLLPMARYGLCCYDENNYYSEWAAMVQRCGIRPLGSYCQRHTCSTRLRELVPAVDDTVVNAILGHSNGSLDDSYTHIGLASKLAAVNRLPCDDA